MRLPILAFFDELSKIAAKIPVQHASSELKKVLRARIGEATSKVDPNDARLYVAMRNRRNRPGTVTFGRQQRAKWAGGKGPVYLYNTKVDTKKGWRPRLTPKAKEQGYSIDDMHEMATSLDDPKSTKKSRGPIWRKLHDLTGTWINPTDASASAKAGKVRQVKD